MAVTVTPAIILEHVDTDLGNTALQRLIDACEQDIIDAHGPHDGSEITERFFPGPSDALIYVNHPLDPAATNSDITVVETSPGALGETQYTLTLDQDYEISGQRGLRRKVSGDFSSLTWAGIVDVTYTPTSDDHPKRTRVLIELVRISIQNQGLRSAVLGDVKMEYLDYENERVKLLRSLNPSAFGYFA